MSDVLHRATQKPGKSLLQVPSLAWGRSQVFVIFERSNYQCLTLCYVHKSKIEEKVCTPIRKLAMVNRLQVKKKGQNLSKILVKNIRQKCQKKSSKKFVKPPVDLHWFFEISISEFISNWDKNSVMNQLKYCEFYYSKIEK